MLKLLITKSGAKITLDQVSSYAPLLALNVYLTHMQSKGCWSYACMQTRPFLHARTCVTASPLFAEQPSRRQKETRHRGVSGVRTPLMHHFPKHACIDC
jgi:hypothetical protein